MLMTNLDKLRQLSRQQRGLLFQSVLLLPLIHVALLVLGHYRLRGALEKLFPLQPTSTPGSETEILAQARATARIVDIVGGHGLYRATCLRRSLLVWWFLRRRGIRSSVSFGVRRLEGRLEAHAWVEYSGAIVNDSANVLENYQALRNVLPSSHWGL
jgi:hypothetical protein